jgi:hypothetical protein
LGAPSFASFAKGRRVFLLDFLYLLLFTKCSPIPVLSSSSIPCPFFLSPLHVPVTFACYRESRSYVMSLSARQTMGHALNLQSVVSLHPCSLAPMLLTNRGPRVLAERIFLVACFLRVTKDRSPMTSRFATHMETGFPVTLSKQTAVPFSVRNKSRDFVGSKIHRFRRSQHTIGSSISPFACPSVVIRFPFCGGHS